MVYILYVRNVLELADDFHRLENWHVSAAAEDGEFFYSKRL